MRSLLIPVSPLERAKSRLRSVFSKEQLQIFTISIFKDFAEKVSHVESFDTKLVFCKSPEILELAENYDLIPIKEKEDNLNRNFDQIIEVFNKIAMERFGATSTTLAFCDIILITPKNFLEISSLIKRNQIVVCPAINSAGVSILSRKPPNIIRTFFSDPEIPSLIALMKEVKRKKLKTAIYDSFRSGFDIDIEIDVVLALEYLKLFNLKRTHTYKFLKENLKLVLHKKSEIDNRELLIKNS